MIIFVLGFSGLVFSLAETSGGIGGKIPLTLFFVFIISIGIMIELKLKEKEGETFGEMEGKGGFR